jgi:hypothetical protein
MDTRDYRFLLPDLYAKIKPLSGVLRHWISPVPPEAQCIDALSVEFVLPDFSYVDPFYGEMQVNSNFQMFFETTDGDRLLTAKSIRELGNTTYRFEPGQLNGCFSNSLDFGITKCSFGAFAKEGIDLTLEYFLTNTESYGNMSGSLEEHAALRSEFTTWITFADVVLKDTREDKSVPLSAYVDAALFAPEKMELIDKKRNPRKYDCYSVPLR